MGAADAADAARLSNTMNHQTLESLAAKLAASQRAVSDNNNRNNSGMPESLSALQKLLNTQSSSMQQNQHQSQFVRQSSIMSQSSTASGFAGSASLLDYLSNLKQQQQQAQPQAPTAASDVVYPEVLRRLSFLQQQPQQQQIPTKQEPMSPRTENEEMTLQRGVKRSSSAEPDKTKARLARNRMTARLRRERKKQEAEVLTKLVAALRLRVKELQGALDKLPKDELAKARAVIDSFGNPPLACLFCSRTFDDSKLLDEHLRLNHTAEIKAREQFLVESKAFGTGDVLKEEGSDSMSMSIASITAASAATAMRYGESGGSPSPSKDEESDTEDGVPLSEMSHEERKKRRLKRNAASARLCRQRKKLYTENLRSQLPGLRHKVRAMESALPEDVVLKIQAASPLPAFLADQEDDIEGAALGPASPGAGRAHSVDGDATSAASVSGMGSPEREVIRAPTAALAALTDKFRLSDSAAGTALTQGFPVDKKVRACSMDSASTAGSAVYASETGEGTPDSLLSVNIPPLNGWGKPSARGRSGFKDTTGGASSPTKRRRTSAEPARKQLAGMSLSAPTLPVPPQAHHGLTSVGPMLTAANASAPSTAITASLAASNSASLAPLLQSMMAINSTKNANKRIEYGSDPEVMSAAIGLQKLVQQQQQRLASSSF